MIGRDSKGTYHRLRLARDEPLSARAQRQAERVEQDRFAAPVSPVRTPSPAPNSGPESR
jgi:hypothetical protein